MEAKVWMKGGGRVQGLSVELGWDASVVEVVGMESGGWIEGMNGVVLTPRGGTVDAALLGVRETGISGEGELARVKFRALRGGDAGFKVAKVEARDGANRSVAGVESRTVAAVPARTELLTMGPNPFRNGASLEYSLARGGRVEVVVYGVDGRRVRTLEQGEKEAGVYRLEWDGKDEGRREVAAGVYYVHMSAGGRTFTRSLVHLR